MVDYIDNAVIFHHEPYASSASEMVAELVQYFGDKYKPNSAAARGDAGGMMLDTKNFIQRTGVRTFEAAGLPAQDGRGHGGGQTDVCHQHERLSGAVQGGGGGTDLPPLRHLRREGEDSGDQDGLGAGGRRAAGHRGRRRLLCLLL